MRYLLLLPLVGCVTPDYGADMVAPATASQYGPVNQTGIVRYSRSGSSDVVSARREDAYKQMWSQCNGKYRIVSEQHGTSQSDEAMTYALATFDPFAAALHHADAKGEVVIKFECVR